MQKVKIELGLLLPEVPDERDACVNRLIALMEDRDGIEKVHVVPASDGKEAQLCFHYNPDVISLDRVEYFARRAGAQVTERYGHLTIEVRGIRHPRHARLIENDLRAAKGILEASAAASGIISIEFDQQITSEEKIFHLISHLKLQVADGRAEEHAHDHEHEHDHAHDHAGHDHAHGGIFGKNTEVIFSLVCGILLGVGFTLSFVKEIPAWTPVTLFCASYFFGGFYLVQEAFHGIRKGEFEIDFLMLVAAAGAAILGQWSEGALLLFLFSMGHALEHYAMDKARKSIAALTELAPKTALLKNGGQVQEVKIETLKPGDVIVVRPNSKIAADGIVVNGNGEVNQAPITGESIPVEKTAVENAEVDIANAGKLESRFRVFAGSINGNGTLEIKVSRPAKDSTIARLVKMVNEAQTQKSPTQHFTDKFEKYFVPFVLLLVLALCFAFLIIHEPFSKSFYRAMAVLVAASPCALAISTPSAVLSGVARAARAGVLIKGGKPLEDLGTLTAIAFDKTGTLTEGKPRLTYVLAFAGSSEEEVLRTAVAVEMLSDHPLAKAIVQDGLKKLGKAEMTHASCLQAISGKGIRASLGSDEIFLGNLALFEELDDAKPQEEFVLQIGKLEAEGNTTMVVRKNKTYIGIVAVMDTARAEAKETIAQLRSEGIRRMIMLTGDNQQVAHAVAQQIGITDAWGSLLPEQKVDAIRKLRNQENKVAMVGDGVNDAPAMAHSTVGIAMGAAGSDVALETADIALMGDQLSLLPFAIGLSRKARQIIRQNLFISLGMVALLLPLTILGIASMGPAVIAHEGSTLVVVFNALRLLAYKK